MNDDTTLLVPGKTPEQLASLRQLTLVTYALYALAWITGGIPAIVAIIINYVKLEDTAGTIYESHFRWQIRTFWWSLAWSVLGFITIFVGVGFIVLIVAGIWSIYRLVKGGLNWNDQKPMQVAA